MATNIVTITDCKFYKAGSDNDGYIVGYASGNLVVRYTFTAPDEGASALSFTKESVGDDQGAVAAGAILRWYVTDDPDGHKNAGPTSEYHGELTMTYKNGWYTVRGSADNLVLVPGKTYYLFVFPGNDAKKYFWWNYPRSITITLSGEAGSVQIRGKTSILKALPYIYTGGQWMLATPNAYKGNAWKISS